MWQSANEGRDVTKANLLKDLLRLGHRARDRTGDTPTVYRYIDWLITVPLLMIEFFIILRAVGGAVGAASFNKLLFGTLIMLVLEKKANLKTLHTLGQTIQQIRATFFASGILMCVAGLVLGLVLGFMTVLGQSIYGWVLITESLPYPVTFTLTNFLLVSGTIMGLGTLASFFGAQRVTGRLLN